MPARTTGAPGASNGQAILAASAFFQQQQQQQQQQAPHHNNGKITTVTFQRLPCLIPSWEKVIYFGINIFFPGSGGNGTDYLPDRPIGYGAFGVVWSVTDPRDGKRVALKKLPNVFQSLVSSKRVFRELKMMRFFKHENVLSCLDILQVRLLLRTFTI